MGGGGRGLASSESSEEGQVGKGRETRAATEAEEAMRPRRRSRAVGRAVASAMVANGGVHRQAPWRWGWRRREERDRGETDLGWGSEVETAAGKR